MQYFQCIPLLTGLENSYIMVNKLWLALEWSWLALYMFHVMLVYTLNRFHPYKG